MFAGVQDVQNAMNSKMSFENLGSPTNWPKAHQPYESTLNRLSQENNELKEKLNSRADNRFYNAMFWQYERDQGFNIGLANACQLDAQRL